MEQMKRTTILLFLSLIFTYAYSQSVSFTAQAPSAVVVGNQFRLTYSVNADAKNLRVAPFTDFRHLAGPSPSTSSSITVINGKMNKNISSTYTYILMAEKEGTFTIPEATIEVKGKKYTSNKVTIKVLKQDAAAAQQTQSTSSSRGVSNNDVFLKTIVTKHKVCQQEYLVATVKMYTRENISNVSNVEFPDFNGFLAYDLKSPTSINYTLENINGRNYNAAILRQTLLYPQHSGKLTIGAASLDATIRIRSNRGQQDLFGDFFSTYQPVTKSLKTESTTITVTPFPEGEPSNFSGIAGTNLSLSSSINTTTIKANEPVTIKITLKGNGNLKLVNTPELKFPADFEAYDPKITNNLNNTTSGVNGTRTFEYLVIPRYAGDFTIPGYSLSYYDLKTKTYKTISTSAFNLKVEKGEGEENGGTQVTAFASKENVKFLGKDIRFIKTDNSPLVPINDFLLDKSLFRWSYLIVFVLFIGILTLIKITRKNNADIVKVKNKTANKMALKRMKMARSLLKEEHDEKFYEEVLNALWGYLSNKLNLPSSQHNRDNVKSILHSKNVDEILITEMNDLLDMCEFARYAPSAVSESKQAIYNRSVELISSLDDTIKK